MRPEGDGSPRGSRPPIGSLAPIVHHRVPDHEGIRSRIWGGKGVGSQGDGSAQLLARSEEDRRAVIEIVARDLFISALPLTLAPMAP